MTREDIKTAVLVRGGWSTTETVEDTDLNSLVNRAVKWAAGYRKWPFTEGKSSTTYVSGTEDYAYPEGWKSDSIRILQIGDKRVQKLNFAKYQEFKEDFPDSSDRVFSDFSGRYHINPNIDLSGTISVWGQYTPADIGDSESTVFASADTEGEEAIVEKTMAYVYERIGELKNAQFRDENAQRRLNELWERIAAEQFAYQEHKDGEGMWKRIDVIKGMRRDDTLKRDQWF